MDSPDYLFFPVGIVLLLNGICAAWLLIRELLEPPRRWRAWLIATSLALLLMALLECITGYYLAIPYAGIATVNVAISAYFLAMFLLVFGQTSSIKAAQLRRYRDHSAEIVRRLPD